MYNCVDTSYGVIKLRPLLYSETSEDVEAYKNAIAKILLSVYPQLQNEPRYTSENENPFLWIPDMTEMGRFNNMQFAFGGCLTKEEITSKIISLFDLALDFLKKEQETKKSDSFNYVYVNIQKYLNITKLFILNGSVTYKYNRRDYDIFD